MALKQQAYELWFHKDVDFAHGETGVEVDRLKQSCEWHFAAQYENGPEGNTWRVIKDTITNKGGYGEIHNHDRSTWVAEKPSEFCRSVFYEVNSYHCNHEGYDPLLGGDIVRGKWTMDGSSSIEEMSEKLRNKANELDRLAKGGFHLDQPVNDDYAFIYPPKPLTIDVEEDDTAVIMNGCECEEKGI